MPDGIPLQTIVVDSIEALERLVEDETIKITFPSQAAEDANQEADWRLHLQICDVMGVTDGYQRADGCVYFTGDWWPDQTAHFAVDATAFSQAHVAALRALLQGEFAGWRITVDIYRDFKSTEPGNDPKRVGGVCIHAMRTLAQRDALQFVEWSSPRLGARDV
jgi:hypothetical protein